MKKRANTPQIGIDIMGSDLPPHDVLESILPILEAMQDKAQFHLFGQKELSALLPASIHITYHSALSAIFMEDHPVIASRKKKGSSMEIGLKKLLDGEIDAFISMGNTGALLAMSRRILGKLTPSTHPALIALLPNATHMLAVLDVGASIECKAPHLLEFAAMGIAYQQLRGISHPSVGILNVGVEANKGPKEIQKAHQLLAHLSSQHPYPFFVGNIEGRDAFNGKADVLITGGFAGNIFLKTAEGTAHLFSSYMPSSMKKQANYRNYPGALLCGVNGMVIKCHGNASAQAIQESVFLGIDLAEKKFLQQLQQRAPSFLHKT